MMFIGLPERILRRQRLPGGIRRGPPPRSVPFLAAAIRSHPDRLAATEVQKPGVFFILASSAASTMSLVAGRARQQQQQIVRLRHHLVRARGRQHPLDVGHWFGSALGADHPHAESRGHARYFLSDRAQSQDAERLAGEGLRHGMDPLGGFLILDRDTDRLGDIEQRGRRCSRGIDSVCVPRAQVMGESPRVDRAARTSRRRLRSSPCAQRSFGIEGSTPGGTALAISASVLASCSAEGLSLRISVSTETRSRGRRP